MSIANLRTLTESDLSQLLAIEVAAQASPWSQETFERCFQLDGRGWVIEQAAGKIIGFILVLVQAGECHILNIGIEPSQQRQGHGFHLLTHALTEVKKQNVEIAYLEVRCSNENAIALYKKIGFKKIGERKNYYLMAEGREDAWVFAQHL